MKKLIIVLVLCATNVIVHGQTEIDADHENILYTGRFEFTNPKAPTFSMNGTSIKVNFMGTGISVRLSSAKRKGYLYVIIDGDDNPLNRQVISIEGSNIQNLVLAEDLTPGSHTLELIKLSEYNSNVIFHGLVIEGSIGDKPVRPSLQLEFYGDSNTAGWNTWNAYDTGKDEASGAYHTFPGMVSRMLGAEYSLIGVGGSGITNRTWLALPDEYDHIHINEPKSQTNTWDFENNYWGLEPAAVVINLGANDLYGGASKSLIKSSWKAFIKDKIRVKYPNAHVVLANSFGWAHNEPADYVHEAVEELIDSGDDNVSYVKFPWLWGQTHAVVNEHAGFANILAKHLADKLGLATPEPSHLSSFATPGKISNGSFENTLIENAPDGWRPHGTVKVIENETEAVDGGKFLRLENGAWVNFATEIDSGTKLTLSFSARADNNLHSGKVRFELKDQAQNTIKSYQFEPDFTTDWQSFTTSYEVKDEAWSIWIVLDSDEASNLEFDDVSLSSQLVLSSPRPNDRLQVYPNPAKHEIRFTLDKQDLGLKIYNQSGRLIHKQQNLNPIDISAWSKGAYQIVAPSLNRSITLIKK